METVADAQFTGQNWADEAHLILTGQHFVPNTV